MDSINLLAVIHHVTKYYIIKNIKYYIINRLNRLTK